MKRYALVIGIGKYANLSELSKPASDAQAVAEMLKKHGDFQEVTLLNGTKAKPGWVDYDTLDAALTKFLKLAANQDALLYFTGHGFTVEESEFDQRGYLATSSSKVKFKGKQIISQEDGFSFNKLNGLVQKASLSSLLLLLDCCHSGFLIEDDLVKQSLQAFSKSNYFLISACRSFQEAYALKRENHSIFTGALLESLLQENAKQGMVTALNALDFIDRALKGSGQEPIFLGMGGAIPVVSYAIAATVEPDETCPYQGLEAFTEATARFFFGRQTDVEALWQKLEQSAFVPVIGASGSGKSSLVRAGLIPALQQSGTNWTVLEPIKPGEEPLTQLRKPLEELSRQLTGKVQLANLLRKAPEGLQPLIQQLPDTARFLLVVDQFEEVFTVCLDEAEQARFIYLVTQVAALPNSRLSVVITMRADFVESCLHYEALKQLIQTQAVYLSPLTGSDLTDAIAKPAEQQGYHLTPALLTEIVKDTREEPGFLPLLQFALTKLWEYRDSEAHALTAEAYVTIGKLAGALDSHADQLYTYSDYIDPQTGELNLSAQWHRSQTEQDWIRAIMLRLVRSGDSEKDTRQRQLRSTLVALAGKTPEAQQQIGLVLESLIKGRLLVSERETIDLAHEALIKGWQRLAGWCQESRELRRLSQRLEAARLEWEKDQHNPKLKPQEKDRNLMMGGLLAEVREQWEDLQTYLSNSEQDKTFFQQSTVHEQNRIAQLERALTQAQQRQVEVEKTEIKALCKSSEALRALNQELDALLESLRAATKLKRLDWSNTNPSIQAQVAITLQQALSWVREQNYIEGHQDTVRAVTFSPDGQIIASASQDRTIKLWSRDGNLLKTLEGHRSGVLCIRFSPDGTMLASGSRDRTIKLWSRDGFLLKTLEGQRDSVLSLDFSPDNRTIASTGENNTVKLCSTDGVLLCTLEGHNDSIMSVRFSPDGKIIASGSNDRTIKLWSFEEGTLLKTLEGHNWGVFSVNFSPDGQTIVSASADHTIKLWSRDGALIETLQAHDGYVTDVSFSPDGEMIASSSWDNTVKLWSRKGQQLKTLIGHSGKVLAISFSPDSQIVISASADRTVKFWSSRSKNILEHGGEVYGLDFNPNSQLIVSSGLDKAVKLWNNDGNLLRTFEGHNDAVWSVKFSSDGQKIASGGQDGTIRLWSVEGNLIHTIVPGSQSWSVDFHPTEQIIASSSGCTVKVWSLDDSTLLKTIEGHTQQVTNVCFSPNGKVLASASKDNTAKLWDLEGNLLATLEHYGWVWGLGFSPDSTLVASSGGDHLVKIWNLDGTLLKVLEGHGSAIQSVCFNPNGKTIASASGDGTVKIWSLDGNLLQTLKNHNCWVRRVVFSPDGKVIASAGNDGRVILWDLELPLEVLIERGCHWVRDYVQNNPSAVESDRHLCDGFEKLKNEMSVNSVEAESDQV